ncbi:MAG TPA: replication-relaxation family protein [Opitutales bacterium]|nr:replication-relaxation family protein [Opitutales bacterium]
MFRSSRFNRAPNIRGLCLTERDLEILRQVARHRFLDSRQISLLVGGSTQQVLRRLQRLFHQGYLDRPHAQIAYYSEDGSRPMVYALASTGARAIGVASHRRPRYDNRNLKQLYMQHTLRVADVMVAFTRASREAEAPRLLLEEDLAPDKSPSKAFQWAVTVKYGSESKRVGTFPDRVFALESPANHERVFYFVEADRATMPVSRHSLNQSSIWRKFLAYEATWSQKIHESRFGTKRFRVLLVTTSQERLDHLVAACSKLPRGHGLFLFTTIDAVRDATNVLTLPWHTGSNKSECVWVA